MVMKIVRIRSYEKGLLFKNGEFKGVIGPGLHVYPDPLNRVSITVASQRDPWISHPDLDVIIRSGALENHAEVLDLRDSQRALVWIDDRFDRVLGPGQYAIWTGVRKIRIEVVTAREPLFEHPEFTTIAKSLSAAQMLNPMSVEPGQAGVYFKDGVHVKNFGPGEYLFWKNTGKIKVVHVDLRESVMDISGQELMSADKVTLRLNAVVGYRITEALTSVTVVDDARQALYREAQLALREVVGTYDLDGLLAAKEKVAADLEQAVKDQAARFGIGITSLGIRDIILPGEMKELMNKVIEARKAADANLIMRREETAAMRSQANTAKMLENNPTLMRLRELDVLEKIAANAKLNVVLGEKGLADKVVNLL